MFQAWQFDICRIVLRSVAVTMTDRTGNLIGAVFTEFPIVDDFGRNFVAAIDTVIDLNN